MVFRTILTWIKSHRLLTTIFVLIVAFCVFILIDSGGLHPKTSTTQKTASSQTASTTTTSSVSKSGTLVCLVQSQKGKAPAQCTMTLKADDGKYYTLVDPDSKNIQINAADLNKRIQVGGTLTSSKDASSTSNAGTIAVQTYGQIQ